MTTDGLRGETGRMEANTFGDWLMRKGGSGVVAARCQAAGLRVGRTHLINIARGRRRLTPRVVEALRQLYRVPATTWLRWMEESGAGVATVERGAR